MRNIKLIFVFLALALAIAPVYAKDLFEEFRKPIPEVELMPEEEFKEKTKFYSEVPFNDQTLAYKVRVPKDWSKVDDYGLGVSNYTVSSKIFGEIDRFYGPPRLMGHRSRLTIQALQLDHQLTAEQWFLQHLLANGYTIQGMNAYDEDVIETLYVVLEHDVSYIVRARAEISGKRVIFVQYYLPVANWEDEKSMQAQVISTFELARAQEEYVEQLVTYQFLDVAEVHYPQSWQLRAPALKSIDHMKLELLNVQNKGENGKTHIVLNGKIDIDLISAYSTESLENEISDFKAELRESGLILKEPVEIEEEYEFSDAFEFAKVEAFEALDINNDIVNYELWIAIMSANDYYYFISLLTPSRKEDFYTWSVNTQAYKVVLEEIKPQSESLTTK